MTGQRGRRLAISGVGTAGRRWALPGHRVFSLAARGLRKVAPPGEVVYRDVDGHLRTADLRDHMESLVFVGRHRLPKEVVALLEPGDWAVDIGANVGSVTGQLCRAVGPAGLVWAVEPLPRNVERLRRLAEANGLSQLEVVPCALGSQHGRAVIRLGGEGASGYSSFTASWIRSGALDVATERLDDLTAAADQGRRLRLVKLDVEGYERQVLEGGEATIRRWRPLIYCEFNDIILSDAGSSSAELLGAFRRLGYSVAPAWRRRSARLAGRNVDLLMVPPAR